MKKPKITNKKKLDRKHLLKLKPEIQAWELKSYYERIIREENEF